MRSVYVKASWNRAICQKSEVVLGLMWILESFNWCELLLPTIHISSAASPFIYWYPNLYPQNQHLGADLWTFGLSCNIFLQDMRMTREKARNSSRMQIQFFFCLGIFENAYDLEFSSWAYSTFKALIFSASFLLFQVGFAFTLLQAIKFQDLHFSRK